MNLNINQAKVNASWIQQSKNGKQEKIQKDEERPQMKEPCSSKAAKALRGMALGLALAAGVTAGSKGMVVQAANYEPENNITTISEEQESNIEKTDVEMAVEEMMEESEVIADESKDVEEVSDIAPDENISEEDCMSFLETVYAVMAFATLTPSAVAVTGFGISVAKEVVSEFISK